MKGKDKTMVTNSLEEVGALETTIVQRLTATKKGGTQIDK